MDPSLIRPTRRSRVLVALVAAFLGACLALLWQAQYPTYRTDFDQLYVGAKAMLAGRDPYAAVRDAHATLWFPLYYPATALVAALPFTVLPLLTAHVLDGAVMTGVLAYAVTARAWWPVAICGAPVLLDNLRNCQTSAWLMAAGFLAPLGGLLIVKPAYGAALLAAAPPRRHYWLAAGTGALVLLALSLILSPGWPGTWLRTLEPDRALFTPPILRPFGWLALTVLARWRRREAWLVLALALAPQTVSPNQAAPLLLVAGSLRELLVLAAIGAPTVVYWYQVPPGTAWPLVLEQGWPWILGLSYLPAIVAVLRKPNVRGRPAWWPV